MPTLLFGLFLAAIFFLLWACISFAIEQTGLRNVNTILAPAATILCIVSMLGSFGNPHPEPLIETILIPWAALGYSMLFVLLLCLLGFLHGRLLRFFDDKYGHAGEESEINGREAWGEQPTREGIDERHEHTRDVCNGSMLARSERRIQKDKTKGL